MQSKRGLGSWFNCLKADSVKNNDTSFKINNGFHLLYKLLIAVP